MAIVIRQQYGYMEDEGCIQTFSKAICWQQLLQNTAIVTLSVNWK